jgi:hypothetical protein
LFFETGSSGWNYIFSQIDGIKRSIGPCGYSKGLPKIGKWYHIKIALLGNTLQWYVDGELWGEYKEIGSSMGMLGFETSGTKINIANLKVRLKGNTVSPKSKER